jgi:general secretion pathway protein H
VTLRRRQRGFTLIEITVAIAIAALLLGAAVYGVGAITGARAKEGASELANAIRTMYDTAALTGKTCRLVFQLPDSKREEDGHVSWHAECAKSAITAAANREDELHDANQKAKEDKLRRPDTRSRRLDSDTGPSMQELMDREKGRVEEASKFGAFSSEGLEEHQYASSVKIEVWTRKLREPIKNGVAYLYFFPQGYTERAQVYVRQGSNVWTITVAPLTGKVAVVSDDLEVPRA